MPANFLGHDLSIHREYYRLPEPTTQINSQVWKDVHAHGEGEVWGFHWKEKSPQIDKFF